MRKPRRQTALQVESLESKAAPSSFVPVLTQNTFNNVVQQIDLAAGNYAKTHNAKQFDARLAQLSTRIPFGQAQLLPTWRENESIYNGTRDGSGAVMVQEIQANLILYVRAGVQSGAFRFR
ncbi:hypothetical protein [Singulisphaera acidiphila]|uniref:Uncharacterized protein n=1 Tax=Singulisphaera acidiphila (strain ATCC BAA-1392 / DSM 18658 / VKM B-2454 / MOB10) TaxID=886293 RepID=L0DPS4_SINAD|nr:hypothetical protein [Singulisphaera acidiphila]AGA30825.1 hypothetical protein Sinac_6755 [Singulisphaera acidiphila DSM 18658]